MPRPARRVEIVTDLMCVHGYLAFTRLMRAVRAYREAGGEAATVFLPYQLRPDAPVAGEPLFEEHKRDRGEAFARAVAADTTTGVADGLELNFRRVVFTSTFDAQLLLAAASAQGKGERTAERLFRAYYTDGLHLADPGTLRRLAEEVGVAVTEDAGERERAGERLRAELARVRGLGPPSVPAVRIDGGPFLAGERDLSEGAFRAALAGRPDASSALG